MRLLELVEPKTLGIGPRNLCFKHSSWWFWCMLKTGITLWSQGKAARTMRVQRKNAQNIFYCFLAIKHLFTIHKTSPIKGSAFLSTPCVQEQMIWFNLMESDRVMNIKFFNLFLNLLATLYGMWDLSSPLTSTCGPCICSSECWPMDHQQSPMSMSFFIWIWPLLFHY